MGSLIVSQHGERAEQRDRSLQPPGAQYDAQPDPPLSRRDGRPYGIGGGWSHGTLLNPNITGRSDKDFDSARALGYQYLAGAQIPVSPRCLSLASIGIFGELSLGRSGGGFSRPLRALWSWTAFLTWHEPAGPIFVYHPHPWEERDWSAGQRVPLEDVWFQAVDGTKLFGWYAENPATSAVLLWCHGNAGNMTHRLENLAALYRLGLSVFSIRLSRLWKSHGRPSEDGLYRDALGATAT